MIKQIWIAQCDVCGLIETARMVRGRYNDTEATLPVGWGHGHNKDVHLCPECSKRAAREVGEVKTSST